VVSGVGVSVLGGPQWANIKTYTSALTSIAEKLKDNSLCPAVTSTAILSNTPAFSCSEVRYLGCLPKKQQYSSVAVLVISFFAILDSGVAVLIWPYGHIYC